jgi:hypothetical protein
MPLTFANTELFKVFGTTVKKNLIQRQRQNPHQRLNQ